MNAEIHLQFQNLGKSATLAINEHSAQLEQEGKDIIRFGFGQSPFPVPTAVVEALKENAHRKEYIPVEGLPELREAVAQYHRDELGLETSAGQVFVGPGTKELMFLLQMILEGDTLMPTPAWVSYPPQAKMVDRPVKFIHTTAELNWLLTSDQLEDELSESSNGPQLLILNYPGNPSGTTYRSEKLEALAETARNHNVFILSDEIYGRLHHDGQHVSMAKYYPEGTIVSTGLSKWCGAGGWRLGHFVFPQEFDRIQDTMAAAASETFSCASAPIQHAAVRAYTTDDSINEYLFHTRRILSTLGNYCSSTLHHAGVQAARPQGGFYLFPDFSNHKEALAARGITDSIALCGQLLQDTGVALLPGSAFYRPPGELTARLAYVNFDGEQTLQNSRAINLDDLSIDDLNPHCDSLIDGISRIVDWIHA